MPRQYRDVSTFQTSRSSRDFSRGTGGSGGMFSYGVAVPTDPIDLLVYTLTNAGVDLGSAAIYDVRYNRSAGGLLDARGASYGPALAVPAGATAPTLTGTSNADYALTFNGTNQALETAADARFNLGASPGTFVYAGSADAGYPACIRNATDWNTSAVILGDAGSDPWGTYRASSTNSGPFSSHTTKHTGIRTHYIESGSVAGSVYSFGIFPDAPAAVCPANGGYTNAAGVLGIGRLSASNWSVTSMRFAMRIPAVLTGAQKALVDAWIATNHPEATGARPAARAALTMIGDSITGGQGASVPGNSWAGLLTTHTAATAQANNLGVNGRLASLIASEAAAFATAGYGVGNVRNVYTLLAGTNDAAASQTADQIIASVTAIAQAVLDTGPNARLVLIGMTPRYDSYFPAIRAAVRTGLMTWRNATTDRTNRVWFVDTSSDAQLGPDTAFGTSTAGSSLSPDGLHPNDAGHSRLYTILQPAVDAALAS